MSDLNGGFGGGRLLKLDAGGLVADTFYTDTEGRGTEWIDLACPECAWHTLCGPTQMLTWLRTAMAVVLRV